MTSARRTLHLLISPVTMGVIICPRLAARARKAKSIATCKRTWTIHGAVVIFAQDRLWTSTEAAKEACNRVVSIFSTVTINWLAILGSLKITYDNCNSLKLLVSVFPEIL